MCEDESREELAARLERELDEFVAGLQSSSGGYRDGWPEDRWEEEMDKHPFFMKQAPDLSTGELPPLLEGLAKLKFDPDGNTPSELALNYKEDGNFYFKSKKYRLSIVSYTEGIKIKCEDDAINCALHNNRAASHYALENYRSSLEDCAKALSYDAGHKKSRSRAAHCAFKLLEFQTCVEHCDKILALGEDPAAEKLKNESIKIIKELTAKEDTRHRVLQAMKTKGIKMYDPTEEDDESELSLSVVPSIDSPAHLADYGYEIIWPVTVLYPQSGTYDYYQEFPESAPLCDLVAEILYASPDWDENKEYRPDTVDVFYMGKNVSNLYAVDLKKSLLDVMRERNFFLRRLSPTFVIKLKNK